MEAPIIDRVTAGFGRTISYLRMSVTDRCDFRYTNLSKNMSFLPKNARRSPSYERNGRLTLATALPSSSEFPAAAIMRPGENRQFLRAVPRFSQRK